MKKFYTYFLIAGMMLAFMPETNAQQVADFENLTLEAESYYDGSIDHSGTEYETEVFTYGSGNVTFSINTTKYGDFFYWGGMAYSNQTDQTTASYTNYSAYATPTGGVNGSSNYGIFFPSFGNTDSLLFTEAANLESVYIANHVWTYHYIMGTDGVGTGIFEADDYLTLTILAYNSSNEEVGNIVVKLADYTEGNSDVIDNWTLVDLSSLENVSYIKFQISSSDTMCPTYFCIDNLSYSTATNANIAEVNDINLYPNPVNDFMNIKNAEGAVYSISDAYGKIVSQGNINSANMRISTTDFAHGIYFVTINYNSERIVKKIIK